MGGQGAHLMMKILWTLMECCPIPNSPTAILLGFNLWGEERCQQNACPGKPDHCLENLWNLAGSVEHCWNLAGTLLTLCWNLLETGETLLEHFAGGQFNAGVDFVFLFTLVLALLNVPGCEVGSLAWTLLELLCNLAGTYTRTTSGFSWWCFLWQAIKDDDPLLKLWCWNSCLSLWRNLRWNPAWTLLSRVQRLQGHGANFQACTRIPRMQVSKVLGFIQD